MIFWAYLKSNKKIVIFMMVVVIIFASIFYLYGIPLDSLLYATLLIVTMGILFGAYDFRRFVIKHRNLIFYQKSIINGMDDLPASRNLIEEDYQELIRVLLEEKSNIVSQMDLNTTNVMDYYTMWVHQIKTPIAAMSLLLQQEEELELNQLREELFKIERYVEMVLQYLRLETITSDLKLQCYSLEGMVRQAVKKYAPLFIRKKIGVDMEGLDVTVITDEKWLVFILEQLLSNAIKYSKGGNIRIYSMKPNTLVIEDSGIGIYPEDLPRVFEKGFTGYNGRMDKQSTGIGLYLCYKICNKLSHPITISSKLNVGTKVMIDLSRENIVIE